MINYPLDLSKKRFTEIPFNIIPKETSWLVLSYNNIEKICDDIKGLRSLERMAINDNKICEISCALNELKKLSWLDLTRNNLKSLPDNLFLINLLGLGLSENEFEEIPQCIFKFLRLKKFGFFYNKIRYISPSIQFLINLVKLDLSNNYIEELPEEICNLRNLTWLNLSHNKIKKLPDCFNKLNKLEELGLGRNCLESLPNLDNLTQLRILSLFGNKLSNFEINSFTIKKIDLSNNLLTLFPNCALKICNLEMLNLKNNKLKKIKLKKPLLTFIKSIDLSNNLLESIPFKFIKSIDKCNIINLENNLFKKKEDFFPPVPSLKEICISKCFSLGVKVNVFVKREYVCDFCNNVFVHKPILVYYRAYLECGDSFVLKEEICKSRCYLGSVRVKNEEFNSYSNK
ncbi:leucine-rich repeat-containing protein [Tubulinosema ratisbonensis]|uniref:Leucine-rich repeat-containing protein n=1 Tax=Tubulinosema ratisbonensis TaxID=291195 RepID=A0A437ANL2_9MICR|nr:leucine-rich repeat-containing protein [Tubulinosema ratisbonensis]